MREKFKNNFPSIILFFLLIAIWQISCDIGVVSSYLLPSPLSIISSLISKFDSLSIATGITICESIVGLVIGVILGFFLACALDLSKLLKNALYPYLSISQAIPIIAIAPLIILALGFGQLPKIVLVALMTFFPIAIACLGGFANTNPGLIEMSKSFGASKLRTLFFVKIPNTLTIFFDSLKISVTYAFSSAVIAEWLGGDIGLGVIMTRARKSFDYQTLFACVIIIIFVTIIFVSLVKFLERKTTRWKAEV